METTQHTEQPIDSAILTNLGLLATHKDHGSWEHAFLWRNNVGVSFFGKDMPYTVIAAQAARNTVSIEQNGETLTVKGVTEKGETVTLVITFTD